MASIQIYKLLPIGFELFEDSESFLNNLTDEEISIVKGGHLSCDLRNFLREITVGSSQFHVLGAYDYQTVANVQGNSINNNTYIGQGINAVSYSNANTIAGI